MLAKLKEKQKAIKFRRKGLSYSEILKKIPVAKSTLSLWLRTVRLAKRQKQRLTEKRLAAILSKRYAEDSLLIFMLYKFFSTLSKYYFNIYLLLVLCVAFFYHFI